MRGPSDVLPNAETTWLEVWDPSSRSYAQVCGDPGRFTNAEAELVCQDLGWKTGWSQRSTVRMSAPAVGLQCAAGRGGMKCSLEPNVALGNSCGNPGEWPFAAGVQCSNGAWSSACAHTPRACFAPKGA